VNNSHIVLGDMFIYRSVCLCFCLSYALCVITWHFSE